MKTNVYIDGFNLYYGALKDTPFKWLNIEDLCRALLDPEEYDIQEIKYFTALVSGESVGNTSASRQKIYLDALSKLNPQVSTYLGQFRERRFRGRLPEDKQVATILRKKPSILLNHFPSILLVLKAMNLNHKAAIEPQIEEIKGILKNRNQKITILKPEEKASDVNLAIELVNDGWKNAYEFALVISNDGDLERALKMVRDDPLNKKVGVVKYHKKDRHLPKSLANNSNLRLEISKEILASSQLPAKISVNDNEIYKPRTW